MLFETVYGAELPRVYAAIGQLGSRNCPVTRSDLFVHFVPGCNAGVTKNLQDAISFLCSAGMVTDEDGRLSALTEAPFRPALLRCLRDIQVDADAPALDRLYLGLVEDLFVLPDRTYRQDIHDAANSVGTFPLTRERVHAWARVLEYLGVGWRVEGGFQCVYSPSLLGEILGLYPAGAYILDEVLQRMIGACLPTHTKAGDAALAVWTPLTYLAERGEIRLYRLQDSPARRYGPNGNTHLAITRRSSRKRSLRLRGDL